MLLLVTRHPGFAAFAVTDQQTGGFAKGPLEMGVADLLAGRAFAGRFVAAADQAGVGEEVADVGEAGDVVDFIEEDQGQDLADAGNGEESVIGVAIVDLGVAVEIEFEFADLGIVGVDESEIGLDAALDAGMGEVAGDVEFCAVARVGELFGEGREVVLAGFVLDVSDEQGNKYYRVWNGITLFY